MKGHNLALHRLLLSHASADEMAGAHQIAGSAKALAPASPAAGPAMSYVICTNPRSGSWLLSDALTATGVAGQPREWFNILERQQLRAEWRMNHTTDLNSLQYLDLVRARSTSANGVSGIKLHYNQFANLPETLGGGDALGGLGASALIDKFFPQVRHIWLVRREKPRQAVSLLKATQTNVWWKMPRLSAIQDERSTEDKLHFDPHLIYEIEKYLWRCDAKWRTYFVEKNIRPLVVYYEDILNNYDATLREILHRLGIKDAERLELRPPRLEKQADSLSEDWLRRYREWPQPKPAIAAAFEQTEMDDPLAARREKIRQCLPDAWKKWIEQEKQRNTADSAIIDVLVNNGYDRKIYAA